MSCDAFVFRLWRMAYLPLVVKVGAAHLRCNDNFDGRPSSWHILLAERTCTCYLPAGSIPPRDRTPCRCYASSFRHMRCMHTASRAKPSSSARFIHRQHMYVMCHRPARRRRRRRQLQRLGRHVSLVRCHLFTRMYLFVLYSTIHQALRGLSTSKSSRDDD